MAQEFSELAKQRYPLKLGTASSKSRQQEKILTLPKGSEKIDSIIQFVAPALW